MLVLLHFIIPLLACAEQHLLRACFSSSSSRRPEYTHERDSSLLELRLTKAFAEGNGLPRTSGFRTWYIRTSQFSLVKASSVAQQHQNLSSLWYNEADLAYLKSDQVLALFGFALDLLLDLGTDH